jgi:hypothetical protein
MTNTAITLRLNNNTVTFSRRGDRATMRNSLGEAVIMTAEEGIARIHTLIDAGWRMA